MELTVLNDLHIGVQRNAGTTPATQMELRQHLLSRFADLLPESGDLMLLGDTFDKSGIPLLDVYRTYGILANWLETHKFSRCYAIAGNHDLSKTSSTLSSFQFLGRLLARAFQGRYVHIEEPLETAYGYVIPHLPSQARFNDELAKVKTSSRLFLHCNYDNSFATESDQSLNLSKALVESLDVGKIIIAHEHHSRVIGNVIVPGNQVASSVADWSGNSDKFFVKIKGDDTELVRCALKDSEFLDIPWTTPVLTEHKFVRFSGVASPEQTPAVLNTINKFRSQSKALVVSNAVQVVTTDSAAMFANSLESTKSFDIWQALGDLLTEAELEVVKNLRK